MGHTIATHVGAAISRDHNLRKETAIKNQKHIDRSGNFEIWKDVPEWNAYRQIFGDAEREYNNRQKRSDRKISDYHKKIKADKSKHTAYEMIISVGNRKNPVPSEVGKEIMLEFVSGWKKRNPHLALIGAYYHADEEGVPHVHLDFIPWADGYKKGMERQTSIRKALEQQGFEGVSPKETAQILWERSENDHLERLCNARGIEVEHPQRGSGIKHAHTELYKAQEAAEHAKAEERHAKRVERLYKPIDEQLGRFIDRLDKQRMPLLHELEEQRKETGIGGKKTIVSTELLDRCVQYMSRTYNLQEQFEEERQLISETFAKWQKETFLQTPESDHRSFVDNYYEQAVELNQGAERTLREAKQLEERSRSKDQRITKLEKEIDTMKTFMDSLHARNKRGDHVTVLDVYNETMRSHHQHEWER